MPKEPQIELPSLVSRSLFPLDINTNHHLAVANMSDDDSSSSSASETEDISKSGLVATRAKRRTAGNLYETLRANLDDEELQKELLAEDEAEDAEDYLASDREDDEAAMESSSSDEDGDAGAAGEDEGERELKKTERLEQRKKRKALDARLRVPGLAPKKKKVKLADDAKGSEDAGGSESERARAAADAAALAKKKKKKSERSNWLPEAADAPIRQSRRELAVKNREVIHANLKESAQRSEKQKQLMKDAAKRVRMTDRLPLTQEQRYEKCRRIEKETAKELGRTEREEAERIRIREEILAAKRRREIDGPVMRTWSGSGVFEDGKLKVKRLGSKTMQEYEVEAKKKDEEARLEAIRKEEEARKEALRKEEEAREEARKQAEEAKRKEEERLEEERKERERVEAARIEAEQAEAREKENERAAMDLFDWGGESSRPGTADQKMEDAPLETHSTLTGLPINDMGMVHELPEHDQFMPSVNTGTTNRAEIEQPNTTAPAHADTPGSWLSGIQEYAAQTETNPSKVETPYVPSASALNTADSMHPENGNCSHQIPASLNPSLSIQPTQLTLAPETQAITAQAPLLNPTQTGGLPGTMTFSANPQPPAASQPTPLQIAPQEPPAPPAPVLREQAQRSLLILSSFPSLDTPQTTATGKPRKSLLATSTNTNPLESTPISRTLIPNSHPPFTAEQARYLSRVLKRNKLDALPDPPSKPKCAVTGWPAKYTDPKTGLPYADLQVYKIIQRMVAGGSAWSAVLGAWVGPQTAVGLRLGRPARGVPEGFASGGESVVSSGGNKAAAAVEVKKEGVDGVTASTS
jgi:vacuolar protein sorting-associated protein 72